MMAISRIHIPRRVLIFTICLVAIVVILFLLELVGISTKEVANGALFVMTPLTLAAVGECINEKAGLVNIGLEGIFLLTAIFGVYGAVHLGSGLAGLLVGSLVGALIGFIFGIISVYGRANQIVAGMGINVFGGGMLLFIMMTLWHATSYEVRPEFMISKISTPLGLLSPIIFVAIAIAILLHFILHRTFLGIKIRAAGEKPEAVDVGGKRVDHIRMFTCILGGALAGLGGAFFSLGWLGTVVKDISAGRGFIALACVVFAGLEPLLALAAAFIFGFAESLAFTVMSLPAAHSFPFLAYFLKMVPYIVPLVVVSIFVGRRAFPKASGKPYIRE